MSLKLIGDRDPTGPPTPPLHRAPFRWGAGAGKWGGPSRAYKREGQSGDPAGVDLGQRLGENVPFFAIGLVPFGSSKLYFSDDLLPRTASIPTTDDDKFLPTATTTAQQTLCPIPDERLGFAFSTRRPKLHSPSFLPQVARIKQTDPPKTP